MIMKEEVATAMCGGRPVANKTGTKIIPPPRPHYQRDHDIPYFGEKDF